MIEFLKNLDVKILCALIGIIGSLMGVIIGAILSSVLTMLVDWLKFCRDENIYYKRKKEETYVEMEDLITDYCAHISEIKKINTINKELREKYNHIRTKAHIYAKKNIADKFYNLLNNIMLEAQGIKDVDVDEWDKLTCDIKKDLGIKD